MPALRFPQFFFNALYSSGAFFSAFVCVHSALSLMPCWHVTSQYLLRSVPAMGVAYKENRV